MGQLDQFDSSSSVRHYLLMATATKLTQLFDSVAHLSVDVGVKELFTHINDLDEMKELSEGPWKKAMSDYRTKNNAAARKLLNANAPKKEKDVEDAASVDDFQADFDAEHPLSGVFYNGATLIRWEDASRADLQGYDDFIQEKIRALRGNAKAVRSLVKIMEKEGKSRLGDCADSRVEDLIREAMAS